MLYLEGVLFSNTSIVTRYCIDTYFDECVTCTHLIEPNDNNDKNMPNMLYAPECRQSDGKDLVDDETLLDMDACFTAFDKDG